MAQITRQQITELLDALQYLPNHPNTVSEKKWTVNAFEDDLTDLSFETVQAAVRQYRSTAIFFPTSGSIREIAMDLQMLAMGIPTPTEAWGMVLTAERHIEAVSCEEMNKHQQAAENAQLHHDGGMYFEAMGFMRKHKCDICTTGGLKEVYAHPVVAETVKLLGGRDIILTDNPTADRARFIEAYREIVSRERKKVAMLPEVKAYITEKRAAQLDAGDELKLLSERMKK